MEDKKAKKGGEKYIPFNERDSKESIVYFTRDLSSEGLKKIYEKINENIDGKVAIKLHTGEPHGPNIIPREWVKDFIKNECPQATIIETNTYYDGDSIYTDQNPIDRYTMPSEVAEYAVMLASDLGNTIVGETLYMSGGRGSIEIR